MRRSVALAGAVVLATLSACDLVEESKASARRQAAELPVVVAAETGDLAGLKALLEKDPTLANSYRWTSTGSGKGTRGRMTWLHRSDSALTASLRKRRIPVVELLLSKGADPNLPIDTGDVPLDILSRADERDETAETLARLLISHGASLGPRSRPERDGGTTTPLLVLLNGTATLPGKEGLLRLYASDARALGVADHRGLTPIHHAAGSGIDRAVEVLLEAGADPNARASAGKETWAEQRPGDTPLHRAAASRSLETIFVLCAGGADPRLRNSAGETPREALPRMAREESARFGTSHSPRLVEGVAAALAPEGPCGTWQATFEREGRPSSWGPVHLARLEHGCAFDDGIACGDLGWAYHKGEEAPVDPAKAMSAFRRACGLERPWGCGMVGALYDAGSGVPEDPAEAAKWFARGCDGNDAQSCTRLARLASSGRGVPQDRALALVLFDKACARKYAAGCEGALALR